MPCDKSPLVFPCLEVHLGHRLGGLIWWAEADEAKALSAEQPKGAIKPSKDH